MEIESEGIATKELERELSGYTPRQETILAIGVFDGVHLGHQFLMEYLKRQALVHDRLSGVVTFSVHPQHVLSPQKQVPYIISLEERISRLRQLGIDLVIPLPFNLEIAQFSARQFVSLLQKHLKMRGLVVGTNFTLGRAKEGDVFALHSLGKEMGFTVDVVSPKIMDGDVVSSTAIRQALAQGDMKKVTKLLGRPFDIRGQVAHGDERGRSLGFPTANITVSSEKALPADGVYVTRAHFSDYVYPSVTNIGKRPTFGQGERTIEVFLLNFQGELYGQELRIEVLERLRSEKRFSDPEELKAQISRDVEQTRAILGKVKNE